MRDAILAIAVVVIIILLSNINESVLIDGKKQAELSLFYLSDGECVRVYKNGHFKLEGCK